MATDSSERGFVLPFALVALTFVYLVAASAYTLSVLEMRMSDAHAASVRAFYLADGAMRETLVRYEDTVTSLVYVFEDGDVTVRISPLVANSSGLHLVRFTATAEVGMRGGGTSVRRVATVAILRAPGDTNPAVPVAVPGTWREIMSW